MPPKAAQLQAQLIQLLLKIPLADRARFARAQLTPAQPALVAAFDAISPGVRARSVLYLSIPPHSRDPRFAAAARLAGWHPHLVHLNPCKYDASKLFHSHHELADQIQLILATWLFPGALVHIFTAIGEQALLCTALKQHTTIIDFYDTCSGFASASTEQIAAERQAFAQADALTARDLRPLYLKRSHGYSLPARILFVHDPIPDGTGPVISLDGSPPELRVVSIGWIGSGDNSIIRTAQAMAASRIHLHVYFNPQQNPDDPDVRTYMALKDSSPYFHIESPVYGHAYWEHLSRYDFGLSILEPMIFGEPCKNYTADYLAGCGSSRLSDYIAARLPIIISPGLRFQHFWARRHATALVAATPDFLANPEPILRAALTQKRHRDLSRITTAACSKRLGAFYEKLASRKP